MPKQAAKRAVVPRVPPKSAGTRPTHEEIAELAYSLWQARGCPEGTPEEDWFKAEGALKKQVGMLPDM